MRSMRRERIRARLGGIFGPAMEMLGPELTVAGAADSAGALAAGALAGAFAGALSGAFAAGFAAGSIGASMSGRSVAEAGFAGLGAAFLGTLVTGALRAGRLAAGRGVFVAVFVAPPLGILALHRLQKASEAELRYPQLHVQADIRFPRTNYV
jgi:hypothetical protein